MEEREGGRRVRIWGWGMEEGDGVMVRGRMGEEGVEMKVNKDER